MHVQTQTNYMTALKRKENVLGLDDTVQCGSIQRGGTANTDEIEGKDRQQS